MVIAVHDDIFHADDALAVYLLLQTNEFASSEIRRTRDPPVYRNCDCVVDIGAIYDHETRRYDHHQLDFKEHFPGSRVPLAASGLIYRHFGREVLAKLFKRHSISLGPDDLAYIYETVYFEFLEEIDGCDNEISPIPDDVVPRYEYRTGIVARIEMKNPHWKTPNPDSDHSFLDAVASIGTEFESLALRTGRFGLKEREMMKIGVRNRFDLSETGEIIEIPFFFPYRKYVQHIEGMELVKFVIYPRSREEWAIRGVETGTSFELRKKLPHAGAEPSELSRLSGVPGALFSHKTGFLAVFDTKDHALEFVRYTLAH